MCAANEVRRALRYECYRGVRAVAAATGAAVAELAYTLQERIMDAIMDAEDSVTPSDAQEIKRHVQRLRLCIDALAFLLLHPHTIRQLGKNAGKPPRLSNQKDACRSALEAAKKHASLGVPALISDLSNLLRISDLVVCDDIETPTLIECKSHVRGPQFLIQGRRGRQASRAVGTLSYLRHDAAKVFGESIPRLAIDTKVLRQKSQNTIVRVLAEAMRSGSSYEFASPYDLVIGVRPQAGAHTVDMGPYLPLFLDFRQPLCGSYVNALRNPDKRIPPAIIWDIDFDAAAALVEEELQLIHVVDVMRFCDVIFEDFRIIKVDFHGEGKAGPCMETEGFGKRGHASLSFVNEVLYWFFTIDSTVEALREAHQLTIKALSNHEYKKAVRTDPDQLQVKPSHVDGLGGSEGEEQFSSGSYRVRLDSGQEFTIEPPDDRQAYP